MAGSGSEPAPPQSPTSSGGERLLGRISAGLALVGGAVLVAVSLVVTAGIGGRWLFGREITGSFEMVQVGVALAAFLFLPLCQFRNANVIVDSLTARAPARVRAALDALWALLYAAVALLLAWRLMLGAGETIASGTVSSMLQLPFGWAMLVGAGALGFLAAVSALLALRHLRGGR